MTALPPKFGRDPLASIPKNLPSEDGENMESAWHRDQMNLLVENLRARWSDRTDYFCGGNMFIHFSPERARNRDFRGPDFFAVLDVDGTRERDYWAVWEEEGKYPDVILELLSPTTENEDRTTKMRIYERTFRTFEYFLYDPETQLLEGYRLNEKQRYRPIAEENGRLWCESFGCWLGHWDGPFQGQTNHWIRMFEPNGELSPIFNEAADQRADAEQHRADAEKRRADVMAEENARLKAELEELRKSKP
jgi:Uma2 family endonuclease